MTRTGRDNDAYDTVEVALIAIRFQAAKLMEKETQKVEWIPLSLISYSSEENLNRSDPIGNPERVEERHFESCEIKRWKLRDLGWV